MRSIFFTAALLAASAAFAQQPGEIQATPGGWSLSLDAPVIRWELQPADAGTITATGPRTAKASTVRECTVLAWITATTCRGCRLQGQSDPQPPVPPIPTPVGSPWVCIVEESSTRPADPKKLDILTGQKIGQLFVAQKWMSGNQPQFARVDKDVKFGSVATDRKAWVSACIASAIADGRPLPLVVWTPSGAWKPTVEPLAADEDAQVARIKVIAGLTGAAP